MMRKKRINFIVTDLDDTIWDWMRMWYNSFEPYLNRISNEYHIDRGILINDFKRLHQKYGTTEVSFIYNELDSLDVDQKSKIDFKGISGKSILHEYYHNKKHNLFLYHDVHETLTKLKENGVVIVGFTESNAFFTKYRLKHLKLDGLIDYIYAPIGNDIPMSVNRVYPEDYWEPEITEIRYLSNGVKKPNKEILEIILADFKADKENTIYIGDKLDRDIFMAQQANITSVYAKYGHNIDDEKYNLLRQVTHWTDEDVKREIEFKNNFQNNKQPDYILGKSFSEIMLFFDFYDFNEIPNKSNKGHIIEIWKKIIDVQQHFNDIEMRIRNYAMTTFTFFIAGVGFLEKENLLYHLCNYNIPAASLFSLIGILVITAFYFMDKFWYHRLLMGAVNQGILIENKWAKIIPEMNSSIAIKKTSPIKILKWKIRSEHKYRIFYGLLISTFILVAFVLFYVHRND